MNGKDNVKRTIWMSDALYALVKTTAKSQGKTVSAYIADVLTDLLTNPLYAAVERHAKLDGQTPEEYIRTSIIDRIALSSARRAAEKEIAKSAAKTK